MKKIQSYILFIILMAALLPAALPEPVQAQSGYLEAEIQPDGSSGYDNYILSTSANTNYGSETTMFIGNSSADTGRGLIKWDFSTLPSDAEVISATLSLWVEEDFATSASTLQAFAFKREWSEINSTYNLYGIDLSWSTPGATGTSDILSEPIIGEVELTDSLTQGTRVDITLSPEYIGHMIRENYFGIMLRSELESSDAYEFYTSDYVTDSEMRPLLTLEYDPDPEINDPGWYCVGCAPIIEPNRILSPYFIETLWGYSPLIMIPVNYGSPGEGNDDANWVGARLLCEPYPLCKNDYPIYYRAQAKINWGAWNNISTSVATLTIKMGGGNNVASEEVYCGYGTFGTCRTIIQGVIQPEAISTTSQAMDFWVKHQFSVPAEYPTQADIDWVITYSLRPFEDQCSDTYVVPTIDTYTIDPTIETPLGMVGDETPADEQGYPTMTGAMYMMRVQNGPWNDGTNDRYDTEVSTDGINYYSLTYFIYFDYVVCYDISMVDENLITVYFTAPTETFYIRVSDGTGAYTNNTNDPETPLQYAIGIALTIPQEVTCDAQFTYDEETNLVTQVTVNGDDDDVPVDHSFVAPYTGLDPAGWYAIQVLDGTSWHEFSPITLRIDLEFKFTVSQDGGFMSSGTEGDATDWADLAEGSALVYCVSPDGMTIYIQAPNQEGITLHLRVNDQDSNFSNNSDAVVVKIFDVTFTRIISGCELQYNVGDLVDSDTVDASATNGQAFGQSLTAQGYSQSYMMTPGGWYVLETKAGPWIAGTTQGLYVSGRSYYDVQIKTEASLAESSSDWAIPSEWPLASCVTSIDALGHIRVYFQVPNNQEGQHEGGAEHFLRVSAPSFLTGGDIGWDLYEAIDISPPGGPLDGCSDFVYDPEVAVGMGNIDAKFEYGDNIIGLEVNSYAAVQIESANDVTDPPYYEKSGWYESSGGSESDDLQLTTDGTTWADLPNHPAVLCYFYTPVDNELVFIFQVLNGQTWKMRADSESFNNNTGKEIYRTFAVTAGDTLDPWTSCSDEYTATVPAINEHEWIPPQDEEGVNLMPTLTYTSENDPNGDGVIWWGDPGLQSGHDYMVETMEGPWEDGEDPSSRYTAQLSSDGGTTWYLFDEHPNVICADEDQIGWYWRAIFHVDTGQVWKIRVADTETEVFTDNTGHLAYGLHLVNEFPLEGPGDYVTDYDPGAFDVCSQFIVRPEALSLSEIGSLGNYLGDWVHYINRSLLSYFAWCPRHTDLIMSAVNALKTREPLATVDEMDTVAKTVAADIDSYDWSGGGYNDTSIFSVDSASEVNGVFSKIMPSNGQAHDVWDGGNLVVFGDSSLPSYFYTCESVFADYLPARLRTGVCFASAYWKDTGASFWVQLLFDIGAIFLLFGMIKGALQSLIYMMTGVRPWTKDGAIKIIETTAQGGNIVKPVENWRRSGR